MSTHSMVNLWQRNGWAERLMALLFALFVAAGNVQAGGVSVVDNVVANTSAYETNPTLGADRFGSLVVYTSQQVFGSVLGPGEIMIQRLQNGAAVGAPQNLSTGFTDDQLNDIYGDNIVFTAFENVGVGQIMLFQQGAAAAVPISTVGAVREAKIHGSIVVWIQGSPGATSAVLWDVNWLGSGLLPMVISGPTPPVSNLDVGDRFVVWDERVASNRDVVAYELSTGIKHSVAADPVAQERLPVTMGPWVVYESLTSTSSTDIIAKNLDTSEVRIIAQNGVQNRNPAIDGDFITYESNVTGNFDIYLYHIPTGQTHPLITGSGDQFLSNVMGGKVAYVDATPVNSLDIHVATFTYSDVIANAGPDQSAHPGMSVTLDGSGSTSPGGGTLSYQWSVVTRPAASVAEPMTPTAVQTSFVPDVPGNYELSLVVSATIGTTVVTSTPDTVVVSTVNTAPVAAAGPDQAVVQIGTLITLDGSASYDVDGDPISYQWQLFPPPGSKAVLKTDKTSPIATFTADVQGEYAAALVVYDPWSSSVDDRVSVSFTNLPPVANAGTNQTVYAGNTATLDGSNSSDPNGDPLTYRWSLVSLPEGSVATLGTPDSVSASLWADVTGTYVVSLVVNDGFVDSAPSNVSVMALTSVTQATQQTSQTMVTINSLSPTVFKNTNMQNALTNKIQAVLADIQAGRYADALNKLQNDVIRKTDGCATGGAPDATDWIKTCSAQAMVHPMLQQLVALLKTLI